MNELKTKDSRVMAVLIVAAAVVWLAGWAIPIMEIDAAQYANMSREMLLSKNYLQLYDRGLDYLDKPPMLIWLSALSMRIFGINDIAYRIPSYLFALLAVYSTYRIARLYYKEKIARLSALVLASCQAMFLITHDVRTDTMLMGWVALAFWQLATWYREGRWKNLLVASLAIAGGMMTKGPIALMVMAFAFGPHFLLQRNFRQFFRWEYLVMVLIIGVALIPMSIGLYQQFDLHPEKVMYGRSGTSGLRFFYWTQSFGRITGESTWSENGYFFFLFQNLLWGFLPWTVFFIGGLIDAVRQLIVQRFRIDSQQEWFTTGGFLLTYCALAISKYQLPHYIYIVLPFAAIITAKWVYRVVYTDSLLRWRKPILVFHAVVFSLLGIALLALLYLPFPPPNGWLIGLCVLAIAGCVMILRRHWLALPALITLPVLAILVINFFIDTGFYPRLLQYQEGVKVSELIRQKQWDKDRFYLYHLNEDRTLHFYSNHFFQHISSPDSLQQGDRLITTEQAKDSLRAGQFTVTDTVADFHVTALSLPFLNPARRSREIRPLYILKKN